jgi:hypothetical protein
MFALVEGANIFQTRCSLRQTHQASWTQLLMGAATAAPEFLTASSIFSRKRVNGHLETQFVATMTHFEAQYQ